MDSMMPLVPYWKEKRNGGKQDKVHIIWAYLMWVPDTIKHEIHDNLLVLGQTPPVYVPGGGGRDSEDSAKHEHASVCSGKMYF